jgi:PTH2 family peptidyl-tRNA hydrolase
MINNTKQVIVLRKDLKMRKGKMVAQGAHASMKVFFDRGYFAAQDSQAHDPYIIDMTVEMEEWVNNIFTKICVSVNSEAELLAIHELAKSLDLPCSLIQDAGLTEFGGVPTYTAVAVGPAKNEDVDKVTGGLPLL